MKNFLVLSVILIFTRLAEASVTINSASSEDLFVCNASREFTANDLENLGGVNITTEFEDLTFDKNSPFYSRSFSKPLTGEDSKLFSQNQSWLRKISKLNFNLGLEKFGGTYSIYFCYLGPLEQKKNANDSDKTQGIYNFEGQIFSSLELYAQKANLKVYVQVACDLRSEGQQTAPRKSQDLAPGNGVLEHDIVLEYGWFDFSKNRVMSSTLNERNYQVPRFCTAKVTFSEAATTSRPALLSQSEFKIDLDFYK